MATLQQIRERERRPLPDGRTGRQTSAQTAQALKDKIRSRQTTPKPLSAIVNNGKNSERKPLCQRCNDFGWVPIGEWHPEYANWVAVSMARYGHVELQNVECPDCVKQRRIDYINHLQEISGLSVTHRMLTLDMIGIERRPRTKAMIDMARLFVGNPYGFVTFHGPYGNGKSTALMAIVNACVAKGISAVYITFGDLVGYARAAFSTQNDSDWDRIRRLAQVPVLCIDEMSPDQVKETDYVRMIQAQIINARYVSGEAGQTGTVVAGNFTLFNETDLPTVSDWIATRLKQGVTVWNNDPDFRPQLGERR